MTKTIFALLLASTVAFAQAKPDELTQLKSDNAMLRIQVTSLQNALIQAQAQEATKNLSEAHTQAVHDLETLNPGKKWDERAGALVDAPKVKADASH